MSLTHGLLLLLTLPCLYSSSVSTSLVGHVLYSADLMFAIYFSHFHLMVHSSKYSLVFPTLYQLYHSPFSFTLNLPSSLY